MRGGKRPGAGRKLSATTKRTREIADAAMAEGLTPLEFMLRVLRDEAKPFDDRFEAAKAAAPYVHPKLSTVDMNAQHDGRLVVEIVDFTAGQTAE